MAPQTRNRPEVTNTRDEQPPAAEAQQEGTDASGSGRGKRKNRAPDENTRYVWNTNPTLSLKY